MGSGELGREIELSAVLDALDQRFDIVATTHSDSMATIRLEEDGPALTLYRTGTFQIRGSETWEDLFAAKDEMVAALKEIGLELKDVSFQQNNAVYLEDFETDIHLEALSLLLGLEDLEYEPEQFPGIIYRPPEIGTVMLIFASGKTIISGTIDESPAKQSVSHLRDKLQKLG